MTLFSFERIWRSLKSFLCNNPHPYNIFTITNITIKRRGGKHFSFKIKHTQLILFFWFYRTQVWWWWREESKLILEMGWKFFIILLLLFLLCQNLWTKNESFTSLEMWERRKLIKEFRYFWMVQKLTAPLVPSIHPSAHKRLMKCIFFLKNKVNFHLNVSERRPFFNISQHSFLLQSVREIFQLWRSIIIVLKKLWNDGVKKKR